MTTSCRLNFWKIQVLVAIDDDYHDVDDDDDYHDEDEGDDYHDEDDDDDYHDQDDDDYHDEIQVHNLGAFGRWRPQDFPQGLAL